MDFDIRAWEFMKTDNLLLTSPYVAPSKTHVVSLNKTLSSEYERVAQGQQGIDARRSRYAVATIMDAHRNPKQIRGHHQGKAPAALGCHRHADESQRYRNPAQQLN